VRSAGISAVVRGHGHVADRQAVSALGLPQLLPELGGGRRPIAWIGRHCMFDRGANIVGDLQIFQLRNRLARHPDELGGATAHRCGVEMRRGR
jgi:hypothetical protein